LLRARLIFLCNRKLLSIT